MGFDRTARLWVGDVHATRNPLPASPMELWKAFRVKGDESASRIHSHGHRYAESPTD
ncbi:hypothetical protein N9L76_10665 [bacterium]|nr:hypothetical protein [bacterium]